MKFPIALLIAASFAAATANAHAPASLNDQTANVIKPASEQTAWYNLYNFARCYNFRVAYWSKNAGHLLDKDMIQFFASSDCSV